MENNGLQIFNNEQFGRVRTITLDGEPCATMGDTMNFSPAIV